MNDGAGNLEAEQDGMDLTGVNDPIRHPCVNAYVRNMTATAHEG